MVAYNPHMPQANRSIYKSNSTEMSLILVNNFNIQNDHLFHLVFELLKIHQLTKVSEKNIVSLLISIKFTSLRHAHITNDLSVILLLQIAVKVNAP